MNILYLCARYFLRQNMPCIINNTDYQTMKKKFLFAALSAALLFSAPDMKGQSTTSSDISPELKQAAITAAEQYKATPEDRKVLKTLFKKRSKEDLVVLGNYYLQSGNMQMAKETVEELYHKDGTYVDGLMLYGNVMFACKEYGKAGEKYDEVIYQNPELKEAYLNKAKVYKFISPTTAEGALMELLNIDPEYKPALREVASIYYAENKVAEATKAYEDYFKVESNPDLDGMKEYAILLFLDKKFAESLAQVEKTLPKDPKDISLNRMKFYDLLEGKEWERAQDQLGHFFGQYNDTLYNYSDYMYLAKLQRHNREYDGAIASLQKSISMNPDFVANYKELGEVYDRAKKREEAVETYKKYIALLGEAVPATELYNFGRIYYSAASDFTDLGDPKFKEYIAAGDTLFAQVSTRGAESYLGPYWRARLNSLTDPQNPLENVKAYYEEAAKRLEGKEGYETAQTECLRYAAFYYMKKDMNAEAKSYCEKILAIDAEDTLAKQILQIISQEQ